MKKRVVCLMVLCLFILSNTAFATNWVLVKRTNIMGWVLEQYVDADNVVQKDGVLRFWYVEKLIKPLGAQQKVHKIEDVTANHQYRILETHFFVNGKFQRSKTDKPSDYQDEAKFKEPLDTALKYVKDGSDIGSVPTPP